MAANIDSPAAKLQKLSKADLIWCILEYEKQNLGWPSVDTILADLQYKKDKENIARCKRLAKKAHDKTMEYCALMRQYEGQPITEVPTEVYERAVKLLREANAADKEWFRLSGINVGCKARYPKGRGPGND